jgi:hypothetical protein
MAIAARFARAGGAWRTHFAQRFGRYTEVGLKAGNDHLFQLAFHQFFDVGQQLKFIHTDQ